MAYLRDVDAVPLQPADEAPPAEALASQATMHLSLLNELWRTSDAQQWGLAREEFNRIILLAGTGQNFGPAPGSAALSEQQAAFFKTINLSDLVLAKACASGNERAWEHFMALYSQPLTRAAIAISGSETVGKDLADAFYAELYGLTLRDGERKCPLDSYRGRGSLLGWLRTTLAQRFVDHYRRTRREEPLDEMTFDAAAADSIPQAEPATLVALNAAVSDALTAQPAEERFLLASYYIDGRTLAEIGVILRVHEATISRRLKRTTDAVRKQLLRNLEKSGMSRRGAEEALGADPRDISLKMDMKKLLQSSLSQPFSEQASGNTAAKEPLTSSLLQEGRDLLPDARESLSDKATSEG